MEFSLSRLPDDICCSILSELDVARCLICCSSEVAKSWRVAAGRHLIWRGIARLWGLTLPALSRRNTRATDDLKVTLFTSWRKRNTAEKQMRDRFLWELRHLLKLKDSIPLLKKLMKKWTAFHQEGGHLPWKTITCVRRTRTLASLPLLFEIEG